MLPLVILIDKPAIYNYPLPITQNPKPKTQTQNPKPEIQNPKPITRNPFGHFTPGAGGLHRLDPRAKLTAALALTVASVLVQRWSGAALLALPLVAAVCARWAALSEVWRDIRALWLFYLLTIVIHLLTGGALPWRGGVNLSAFLPSVGRGLFFSVRIALLAGAAGMLLRTTHPADWTRALESSVPRRGVLALPLRKLALVFGLAVRFLPVTLAEAERIRAAQVNRGLKVGGGLLQRVRSLIPLAVPLVAGTLDRAESVTTTLMVRGYNLHVPRTCYQPLKFGWRDAVALTVVFGAAFASLALEFGWLGNG